MVWVFKDTGAAVDLGFGSQQRVQKDGLGCVRWASASGGLFQIYHFLAREAMRPSELVGVLRRHRGRSDPSPISSRKIGTYLPGYARLRQVFD